MYLDRYIPTSWLSMCAITTTYIPSIIAWVGSSYAYLIITHRYLFALHTPLTISFDSFINTNPGPFECGSGFEKCTGKIIVNSTTRYLLL